ncbi:hypothetical protein ISN45_Aa08g009970 [Arabidopsis thaliana x Arabidopsis arenosa]|uniref:DUF659 domain-containing protein n=1 Tax=Arabidopsis thaliana x Arabidopsis arenosa TaxID=1240361 RepID=A0A8T1XFP8_9BRAS|nr:hypothetical protein ISN45_Aa08g009970 [Arabidopsis thaliana x Arabidopsis arenosa]
MRLGDLLEALAPGSQGVMRASTHSAPQKEKDHPKNLDPVRKHAVPVSGKYGSWTCIYCKKVTNGGVQRANQHIVGGFRNVTQCSLVPPNVREEIKDFILKKAEIKATTQMMPPLGTSYEDYDYEEEEEEVEVLARLPFNAVNFDSFKEALELVGQYGTSSKPPTMYELRVPLLKKKVNAIEKKLVEHKEEWGTRGCSIISDGWRDSVLQKVIVNFLVNSPKGSVFIKSVDVSTVVKDANILFDHLDRMVEEVGEANVVQVRTAYGETTSFILSPCAVHCIDLILEDIGKIPQPPVKKRKGPMDKFVCPTPPDVLKGRKGNRKDIFGVCDKELRDRACGAIARWFYDVWLPFNAVNFDSFKEALKLVGQYVDVSTVVKDDNMLFDHLDRMVEEVGEANDVQVVADNAPNYVKASLILEDIEKNPQVKTVIKNCIFMNGYIYGHSSLVNMMRKFTNQGNLHRPVVTRFATSFITLAEYYRQRKNLRSFVNSQDWLDSKWPKEARTRNVKRIILQDSFWHNVLYTLQFTGPLVKVLRLVDGEKKPAMVYIYEAVDRAKESIASTFKVDCEEVSIGLYSTLERGSTQSSSRTAKGKNTATCSTPTPRASQRMAPTPMTLIDEDDEIEEHFGGGDEDNEIKEDFVGDDDDETDF